MPKQAMVEAAGQEVERFTVSTFNVIQAQADVAKMGRIIEVQTAAHRELERKHSERKLYISPFQHIQLFL